MATFISITIFFVGIWVGRYTGYQKGIIDGLKEGLDIVKNHDEKDFHATSKRLDKLINKLG